MASFDFKSWCDGNGLKKATVDELEKNDLDILEALKLVAAEDIATLELTLGQRKLLLQAVQGLSKTKNEEKEDNQIKSEDETTPVTTKTLAKDGGLEEILKKIELDDPLYTLGATEQPSLSAPLGRLDQNPQVFLGSTTQQSSKKGGETKPLLIPDFVHNGAYDESFEEEQEIVGSLGARIVLRAPKAKPKLENVSLTIRTWIYNKLGQGGRTLSAIDFLGIEIDTVRRQLTLPDRKLCELRLLLNETMAKRSITKRDLQSLVGKLNFAARVVFGGRTFLRRIIDNVNHMQRPHHHVRLNAQLRADLAWWTEFLGVFNGKTFFVESEPVQLDEFSTDACPVGGGGDWFYINWDTDQPRLADVHINLQETFTVLAALERWKEELRDQWITVRTDNTTTLSAINKGTSGNTLVMQWLRKIFWLSATYNFRVTSRYISTASNTMADAISRIMTLRTANCLCGNFFPTPYKAGLMPSHTCLITPLTHYPC
ncbi:hypothetical protein QZH41_015390, partial [Actinostola sp. cb2023]